MLSACSAIHTACPCSPHASAWLGLGLGSGSGFGFGLGLGSGFGFGSGSGLGERAHQVRAAASELTHLPLIAREAIRGARIVPHLG